MSANDIGFRRFEREEEEASYYKETPPVLTNFNTRAQRIARLIKWNVDLWYADVISFGRFNQRSARLWRIAETLAVVEEVRELTVPPMTSLTRLQ